MSASPPAGATDTPRSKVEPGDHAGHGPARRHIHHPPARSTTVSQGKYTAAFARRTPAV